jgi:hypothetical protein
MNQGCDPPEVVPASKPGRTDVHVSQSPNPGESSSNVCSIITTVVFTFERKRVVKLTTERIKVVRDAYYIARAVGVEVGKKC